MYDNGEVYLEDTNELICEDSGEECLDEYITNITYSLVTVTLGDDTYYFEVYGSGVVID